jgi:hypothetical protein
MNIGILVLRRRSLLDQILHSRLVGQTSIQAGGDVDELA